MNKNKNKLLMKSLPLVASVLGRKYGVKVQIGGARAFTDGKIIQLPAMPLECDEALLNLARGYLDHEAAHVRETNFEWLKLAKLNPIEMHIWNTLEDWRVENRLAEIFPGCRQNFKWLIRHLFINDSGQSQDDEKDPASAILNCLLLVVRSWDVPELADKCLSTASIVEKHYPGLLSQWDSVLQKVRTKCDSTQDCILYTREIVSLLKGYLEQNDNAHKHKSKKATSSIQNLEKLLNSNTTNLPKGIGEILGEHLIHHAPENADQGLQVAKDGYKRLTELDETELAQTRRSSTALKSRLHGIIQAKTINHDRIGRHGSLSTAHLHRIAVGNPRMFRSRQESQGISTAVHILIDC